MTHNGSHLSGQLASFLSRLLNPVRAGRFGIWAESMYNTRPGTRNTCTCVFEGQWFRAMGHERLTIGARAVIGPLRLSKACNVMDEMSPLSLPSMVGKPVM